MVHIHTYASLCGRNMMHFLMAMERLPLHQSKHFSPRSPAHTRNAFNQSAVSEAHPTSASIYIACIDTRQRKSQVQLTTPPTRNLIRQSIWPIPASSTNSRASGNCCLPNKSKLQLNKIANFNDDSNHKFIAKTGK